MAAQMYSSSRSIQLVGNDTRWILRIDACRSDGITDFHPKNLKPPSIATLKPGEHFEWYVRSAPGQSANTLYRTQLGDLLAQEFGFAGEDKWILDGLPEGYSAYTYEKGRLNSSGKLEVNQEHHYLYGHPSGQRFNTPAEFIQHLASLVIRTQNSLTGAPRHTVIPHNPHRECTCKKCTGKSESNLVDITSRAKAQKEAAIAANAKLSKEERLKAMKDGGWKFRMGEIVWAYQRYENSQLGGTWFAGVVMAVPEMASFQDFANIFTSMEGGRGLYRIQKCGSDSVMTVHASNILPWTKKPQPEARKNTTLDATSVEAAKEATCSISVVYWDPNDIIEDEERGMRMTPIKSMFFGSEKIFVGDAIRIKPPKGFKENISIWDPQQYDILIIRRMFIYAPMEPTVGEDGVPTLEAVWYFGGDVLTMYPGPNDKITKDLERPVPNYIKTTGQKERAWVARAMDPGKLAFVSTPHCLGRFYDYRIIGLMESRWETLDSALTIDGYLLDRARSLGFESINGETLRDSAFHEGNRPSVGREGSHYGSYEPSNEYVSRRASSHLPNNNRNLFSAEEKARLLKNGDIMSDQELMEYHTKSGGISAPKSHHNAGGYRESDDHTMGGMGPPEDVSNPLRKKRRTD